MPSQRLTRVETLKDDHAKQVSELVAAHTAIRRAVVRLIAAQSWAHLSAPISTSVIVEGSRVEKR